MCYSSALPRRNMAAVARVTPDNRSRLADNYGRLRTIKIAWILRTTFTTRSHVSSLGRICICFVSKQIKN